MVDITTDPAIVLSINSQFLMVDITTDPAIVLSIYSQF